MTASPHLTADDLAAGRGLQFIPGAVDNVATNKEKIRGIEGKLWRIVVIKKTLQLNM